MSSKLALAALVVSAALAFPALAFPALAAPPKDHGACPAGKVRARGECLDPCPTGHPFADPSSCECPKGFGKVLFGNGGGECKRLVCATGSVIDPRACDCPDGYQKKDAGKGKARCVVRKAAGAK